MSDGVRDRPRTLFFFFNDTATTEIYTLSLHDALPIYTADSIASGPVEARRARSALLPFARRSRAKGSSAEDRKSTRLNSSHGYISYAVFCLKKKCIPSTLRSASTAATSPEATASTITR